MYIVLLEKLEKYDWKDIYNFLANNIKYIHNNTFQHKKILIKPNFLRPSQPDKAIITHPEIIKGVINFFKDSGAKIIVGDSPGFGNIYKVIEKASLTDFFKKNNIIISDFSKTKKITSKGFIFRELDLPVDIIESNYIVNIPKLKTHQMMYLTMAVKNLYGCIYGLKKVSYHLTAGKDYKIFASLLLDIYATLNPQINILDGIIGMEGNGPSSGTTRHFGLIALSNNALSLDRVVSEILKVPYQKVPYLKIAEERKLKEADMSQIQVWGKEKFFSLNEIKPPPNYASNFSLPSFINNFINSFLISYPEATKGCKACGICKKHCPAKAITIVTKAVINKAKCIRCFCCQELCEHNAIKTKKRII
jgi:uncharacterized protein (DUF362 family)/Pyruvate/2-oxoacid:ferredoxin oxidoreductase delta subunit